MGNNTQVRIMPDGSTRVGGEPWPKEVKELAFELWYMICKRNVREVCDYLNNFQERFLGDIDIDTSTYDMDVITLALEERPMSIQTLYAWSKTGKWPERAEQRHRLIAPALYAQVDQLLEISSIPATKRLVQLATDPSTPPKIALDAANSILDRTGHTAWVRPSDDGKIQGPQRDYTGTVAGKSMDDLLRIALGTGDKE